VHRVEQILVTANVPDACVTVGDVGFRLNPGHLLPEKIRDRPHHRCMEVEPQKAYENFHSTWLECRFENVASFRPLAEINRCAKYVPFIKAHAAPTMTVLLRQS
jgi:hypothetical protein